VDGPYKTKSAAAAHAASMSRVDYAQRGGRYVVFAALNDHLERPVHRVAVCLSQRAPHRSFSF
jgi:hypothetical protein